jgi:hypothetical protein
LGQKGYKCFVARDLTTRQLIALTNGELPSPLFRILSCLFAELNSNALSIRDREAHGQVLVLGDALVAGKLASAGTARPERPGWGKARGRISQSI